MLFPFTRLRNAQGKPIEVGYGGSVPRIVPPGATTGATMFGRLGPPKGWKSAAIEPATDTAYGLLSIPVTLSPPKGLRTSLGMLAVTTVSNPADTTTWCGAVGATVVRDGVAVGGGSEDTDCALPLGTWTEIVRLYGDGEASDDFYVELLGAHPE